MAITKTVTVRLEVTEAPDFFPEVVPTVLSVVKGVVARYLCSIVANSTFTGQVRLTVSGAPSADITVAPDVIGTGDVAEISIGTTDVDPGTFDFQVTFEEI